MTNKIKRYMDLMNSPRSSCLAEEMSLAEEIRELLGENKELKKENITRYIRDTGDKKTVIYETRRGDAIETAFILSELQKEYPKDVIFATISERWTVNG